MTNVVLGISAIFGRALSKKSKGLILHNTLAVTDEGVPLGLGDQRFIDLKSFSGENAKEKRTIRNWNRRIEQKESVRWINVVKKSHEIDFGSTRTIHVANRECDLYEFYRDAADLGENVLVRAAKNRSINKRYRREAPKCLLFDDGPTRRTHGRTDQGTWHGSASTGHHLSRLQQSTQDGRAGPDVQKQTIYEIERLDTAQYASGNR